MNNNELKRIFKKFYDLTKAPITFFDIESTGIDKISDEIIQLYLCKYDGKEFIESESYYDTNVPIRKEAYEKHGIDNESLKGNPYFSECAKDIYENYFSKGTVLCGYSSNGFDIPFIIEKFLQCKIPSAVNILSNKRIDVFHVYRKLYPNTLEGVYKRLLKKDMGTAHNAKNDVVATIEILDTLIDENKINIDDIISHSETIDTDEFFQRKDNAIYFAKGKFKGKDILELNPIDSLGFLKWMCGMKTISIHTRTIANKLINIIESKSMNSTNLKEY